MSSRDLEFIELRRTIAVRGTARLVLGPATLALWAVVAMQSRYGDQRVQILLPLLTLAGGFEAVRALHVGVERIGRYLQVFHETPAGPDSATWETAAMEPAAAAPGLRLDPLFGALFLLACAANASLSWDTIAPTLTGLWVLAHSGFALRIAVSVRACRRQRAQDLAHYRTVRHSLSSRLSSRASTEGRSTPAD